jgi:hypothetical protein
VGFLLSNTQIVWFMGGVFCAADLGETRAPCSMRDNVVFGERYAAIREPCDIRATSAAMGLSGAGDRLGDAAGLRHAHSF